MADLEGAKTINNGSVERSTPPVPNTSDMKLKNMITSESPSPANGKREYSHEEDSAEPLTKKSRNFDSFKEEPDSLPLTNGHADLEMVSENMKQEPVEQTVAEQLIPAVASNLTENTESVEHKPQSETEIKKEKKYNSDPEVITLSDSEDEMKEILADIPNLSEVKRMKLIRRCREHLRSEETKLILLKKLRLSIISHEPSQKSHTVSDYKHGSQLKATPPPLTRSLPNGSHRQNTFNQNKVLQSGGLQTNSSHQVSHHSQSSSNRSHHQNSSGPPPLVNMNKSSYPTSANTSNAVNGGETHRSTTPVHKKPPPPPPPVTAEQKRAAIKSTCRKQVEQALLKIPPAKVPPPEVNFIPNLAGAEFVCLIGMEEVVKHLLSPDQKDVKYVFNPFSCVQCKTDFTPVWKRDKPGSKNVICERCITSNQKKILRQEHATKLKAVFTSALQMEQELERRIASGSPMSDIPAIAALAKTNAAAASSTSHQQHSTTPSMPTLQHSQYAGSNTSASGSGSSSTQSSGRLTQAQLQQHQALMQAQEQMRAMLTAQALAYPQLQQFYGVTSKQAADIQRQYLLDMINPTRGWKT